MDQGDQSDSEGNGKGKEATVMHCPRCDGRNVVDPMFVREARNTFVKLTAELVLFADNNKIDYRKMPILTEVARAVRIIEMM